MRGTWWRLWWPGIDSPGAPHTVDTLSAAPARFEAEEPPGATARPSGRSSEAPGLCGGSCFSAGPPPPRSPLGRHRPGSRGRLRRPVGASAWGRTPPQRRPAPQPDTWGVALQAGVRKASAVCLPDVERLVPGGPPVRQRALVVVKQPAGSRLLRCDRYAPCWRCCVHGPHGRTSSRGQGCQGRPVSRHRLPCDPGSAGACFPHLPRHLPQKKMGQPPRPPLVRPAGVGAQVLVGPTSRRLRLCNTRGAGPPPHTRRGLRTSA